VDVLVESSRAKVTPQPSPKLRMKSENDHLHLDLVDIVIGVCELHRLGEF